MANGPAESLFQLAQQGVSASEGTLKEGLELGQQIQKVEAQRQQIESSKEALQFKKLDTVIKNIQTGMTKVPKKAQRAYFKNFIKPQAAAVKLNIDDSFLDALASEDVNTNALFDSFSKFRSGVRDGIRSGNLDFDPSVRQAGSDILEAFNGDTSKFGSFLNTAFGAEASAFAQEQSLKAGQARAAQALQAKERQQEKTIATAGITAANREFGKEAARFRAAGGQANIDKNIKLLESAIKDLEDPDKISGSVRNAIPLIGSDAATDILDPKLASIRDRIRSAIQGTLRETLGAQFTEKEGEAIFSRAFNPRLSDKENIRRVKAEVEALKAQAQNKIDRINFFEKTGSMQGFVPKAAPRQAGPALPEQQLGAIKQRAAQALQQGISKEVLGQQLKSRFPQLNDEQINEILGR